MIKVLFICHGNICRSPMCEFVLKNMVEEWGIADEFLIESAATSDEECYGGYGNPVYPPAMAELMSHGIGTTDNELGLSEKRARQFKRSEYDNWDYIICAEDRNVRALERIIGGDPKNKITRLLDYTDTPGDINDPWYTGDFSGVYKQIEKGCKAFLEKLNY